MPISSWEMFFLQDPAALSVRSFGTDAIESNLSERHEDKDRKWLCGNNISYRSAGKIQKRGKIYEVSAV